MKPIIKGRISVDLDGTTWNSHKPFIDSYNKLYNKNMSYEEINKWGFLPEEVFWDIYGESSKKIMEYKMSDYVNIQLGMLINFYHISFVTHGLYTNKQIEKKLAEEGIFKYKLYDDIIVDDKTKKKVRLDFDYFIDDNPNMVADMIAYPDKTLLLFDQPWNRDIEVKYAPYQNVVRVKDWDYIGFYFLNKILEELNNG